MLIYPAIDLRGGKVVHLKEGRPDEQTIYSDDPIATAQAWAADGAQWIHVVNLDGAFAAANDNGAILEAVAKLNVPIQFGGGLRRIDDLEEALERGATRVVLGTAAIERPELLAEAVQRWGEDRVCVALDARDGKVATHGWQNKTDLTPIELGKQMAAMGIRHALYTDVNRDGGLRGSNIEATVALAQETGLAVIASGGVSSLDEIRELAASGVVAGAVIGTALYEGRMTLLEAIEAAGESNAG